MTGPEHYLGGMSETAQRTRAWFAATERGEVHAFDTETEAEEWARLNSAGGRVAVWSAEVEA